MLGRVRAVGPVSGDSTASGSGVSFISVCLAADNGMALEYTGLIWVEAAAEHEADPSFRTVARAVTGASNGRPEGGGAYAGPER